MDPEIVSKAENAGWKARSNNVLAIKIEHGDTGHSFEKLFSPFIKENLKKISIQEPFLYSNTHKENWDNFLAVLFKYSKSLNTISLETKRPGNESDEKKQDQIIKEWVTNFKNKFSSDDGQSFNIKFEYKMNPSLHKRKIEFKDYGIEIDLDRGLDLFCPKANFNGTDEDWKILENRPWREAEFKADQSSSTSSGIRLDDAQTKGNIANILASDPIAREKLSMILGIIGINSDLIGPNLSTLLLCGLMSYSDCFKKMIDVWNGRHINSSPPTVQALIKILISKHLELNLCASNIAKEYGLQLIQNPTTRLFELKE